MKYKKTLAKLINIYYNNKADDKSVEILYNNFGFCFCHAVCWSCATERREPCQAGNRAALSGQPVRHSPPAHRVTEAKFFYVGDMKKVKLLMFIVIVAFTTVGDGDPDIPYRINFTVLC